MKFLRRPEVIDRTGLSYPTIYRLELAGKFPARRSLGPNSVGWVEAEVLEWMKARARRVASAASPDIAAA